MSATETSAQSISAGPVPEQALVQPTNFGPVSEAAGRAVIPQQTMSERQRQFRLIGLEVSMVAGEAALRYLGARPEGVGRAVDVAHDLTSDPEVLDGLAAAGRFAGNAVLTAVGVIPVVGEGISVAAEVALKTSGYDLMPDVSGGHKLAGYAAHAATGGIVPQLGAIEQSVKDWHKFVNGLGAIGETISEFRETRKKSDYILAA